MSLLLVIELIIACWSRHKSKKIAISNAAALETYLLQVVQNLAGFPIESQQFCIGFLKIKTVYLCIMISGWGDFATEFDFPAFGGHCDGIMSCKLGCMDVPILAVEDYNTEKLLDQSFRKQANTHSNIYYRKYSPLGSPASSIGIGYSLCTFVLTILTKARTKPRFNFIEKLPWMEMWR